MARNLWLDSLYIRYVQPQLALSLEDALVGALPTVLHRPRLWLTHVTFDGAGGAAGVTVESVDVFASGALLPQRSSPRVCACFVPVASQPAARCSPSTPLPLVRLPYPHGMCGRSNTAELATPL